MKIAKNQFLTLIVPGGLLLIFGLVVPLVYFFRFSFMEPSITSFAEPGISVQNFVTIASNPYYVGVFVRTLVMAFVATVITLVLSLPVALHLSRSRGLRKNLLVVLALFPLLIGSVVRSIGWLALFGYTGLLNGLLGTLGWQDTPQNFSQNVYSVTLALGILLVPICILVLTSTLESLDPSVERAAHDLGARPTRVFYQILVPQMVPGILAATSLVFVLNMNAYATPLLVGGPGVQMMATQMYSTMVAGNNWPLGAAMAVVLVVTSLGAISIYSLFVRTQLLKWKSR